MESEKPVFTLADINQMPKSLRFEGETIVLKDKSAEVQFDDTTWKFIQQFDTLVFRDAEGHKAMYVKEEVTDA